MIHNPGNTTKLDSVYAWLSVDSEGREGIIAGIVGGQKMPFVFGDLKLAKMLEPLVKQTLTQMPNLGARLVRYDKKVSLIEIPGAAN